MANAEKVQYTIGLTDKVSPGLTRVNAKANRLDRSMGGLKKSSGGASTAFAGLSKAGGYLAAAMGAATAGMAAFNYASDAAAETRKWESLENSIRFVSGTTKEADKNMKFLRQTSEDLGTDLQAGSRGFKSFSASMKGTELQGEVTRRMYKQVSMATTALGLTGHETEGVFLALSQMMGKGKVSAEELRGQLAERLPGGIKMAADALGITQAKLDELLSKGMIPAKDFLPRFANELEKNFAGALPKAVNSSQAQFNRFNNRLFELKLIVGRAVLPIINKFLKSFNNLFKFLMKNKQTIVENVFIPLKEAFGDVAWVYISLIDQIGNALGLGGDKTEVFQKAMIRLKYTILTVGKVLQWLIFTSSIVTRVIIFLFDKMNKSAKIGAAVLISAFTAIKKAITPILEGISTAFEGLTTFNYSKVKQGVTQVAKATTVGLKEEFFKNFDFLTKDGPKQDFSLEKLLKESSKGEKKTIGSTLTTFGAFTPTGGDKDKKKASSTVDGVKSGRPTHINIDIGKLIETFNVSASDDVDMSAKIKDAVAKALFSAVNNVNNIVGT